MKELLNPGKLAELITSASLAFSGESMGNIYIMISGLLATLFFAWNWILDIDR